MDWWRQIEVIQFQNHLLASDSVDILSTLSKGAHYINNDGNLHKNSMSSTGIYIQCKDVAYSDVMWLPGTSQLWIMMVLLWGSSVHIKTQYSHLWRVNEKHYPVYTVIIQLQTNEESQLWKRAHVTVLMDAEAVINNELPCEKPTLELGIYYIDSWKTQWLHEEIIIHILLYMWNHHWKYFLYNFTSISLLNEVYIYSKQN